MPSRGDLAERCGGLDYATSANRSGSPPATTVDATSARCWQIRACVPIDGGRNAGRRPSTIVDARGEAPTLVREGAIAWSRVLKSLDK